MIDKKLINYEFGVVTKRLRSNKTDAMFKYHLIPSGRAWMYTYHFRSNDIWNNFLAILF